MYLCVRYMSVANVMFAQPRNNNTLQSSRGSSRSNSNNNNRNSTIKFIYHYGTMLRYLPSTSTCLCVHTVHISTHMVLYLVVCRLTAITSRQQQQQQHQQHSLLPSQPKIGRLQSLFLFLHPCAPVCVCVSACLNKYSHFINAFHIIFIASFFFCSRLSNSI